MALLLEENPLLFIFNPPIKYALRKVNYGIYGLLKKPHRYLFVCTEGLRSDCAHVDIYDHFGLFHHHVINPDFLTLFVTFVSILGFLVLLNQVHVPLNSLLFDLISLVIDSVERHLLPKTQIQKDISRIISQWCSGDSLKKEQILNDLDTFCLDNGWCIEEVVPDLRE